MGNLQFLPRPEPARRLRALYEQSEPERRMKRPIRSAEALKDRPPGRTPARAAPVDMELEIGEIGARGDAVARGDNGPLYLPYALPGERVRARVAGERGEIITIETPSAER